MKKLFALLMLCLFLLNVLGYYGVLVGLQAKNTKSLIARFDNDDYSRQHEITIKVPITVPYASDSREYTRVDGEFEHQGEIFRMVKQKLQQDTLFIVCVKDNTSKGLKQVLTDYVASFTDKPATEKSQTQLLQNFIKDFIATTTQLQSNTTGWNSELPQSVRVPMYQSIGLTLSNPPPQV
ncbi:MAG: hypothetical protein KF775_17655 [Cyclobacteriaceae bacterium]|nr:hypothetical protein [Cyclobacteriaceae bacterium]